jgi:hypothetical protein
MERGWRSDEREGGEMAVNKPDENAGKDDDPVVSSPTGAIQAKYPVKRSDQ